MRRYLLHRLLWQVPTWLGVVLLVLVAVDLAPGDAATAALGSNLEGGVDAASVSAERLAEYRAAYLLDRSVLVRLAHFLGPFDWSPTGHEWLGGSGRDRWHGLLALDLGEEWNRPGVSVARELASRLALTVPLSGAAIALALGASLALGLWSAARRGSALDRALGVSLFALDSVPAFFGGMLLVLLFGARGLGLLPSLGIASSDAADMHWARAALDVLWHAILPVATLSYGALAYLTRQVRSGALVALSSDAVRTARAKGLSEWQVLRRHVLPHERILLFTLVSGMAPALVGGSLVVETVFDLPGMGRYAWEGLKRHDLGVVLATTACAAAVTLFVAWLAEAASLWADPRRRAEFASPHE